MANFHQAQWDCHYLGKLYNSSLPTPLLIFLPSSRKGWKGEICDNLCGKWFARSLFSPSILFSLFLVSELNKSNENQWKTMSVGQEKLRAWKSLPRAIFDSLFSFIFLTCILNFSVSRYGPIFRSNLVGRPIIVSTDPDLNYFVFQQEGNLFQSWYPDTFTEIFGRQNVGSLHGVMYKYLKNMVLHLFGPESLKKMIPEIEQAALSRLQQWSSLDSTELKDSIASVFSW